MLAHDVWAGLFEVEANMVFDNVHVKGESFNWHISCTACKETQAQYLQLAASPSTAISQKDPDR